MNQLIGTSLTSLLTIANQDTTTNLRSLRHKALYATDRDHETTTTSDRLLRPRSNNNLKDLVSHQDLNLQNNNQRSSDRDRETTEAMTLQCLLQRTTTTTTCLLQDRVLNRMCEIPTGQGQGCVNRPLLLLAALTLLRFQQVAYMLLLLVNKLLLDRLYQSSLT